MKHVRNFSSQLSKTSFDDTVDRLSITISALEVFSKFIQKDTSTTITSFSNSFWKARDVLFSSRTNDPLLSNALLFSSKKVFSQHTVSRAKSVAILQIHEAINHIKKISDKISHFSYHKIPKGGTIFVHGCDPLILHALLSTHKRGKKFNVVLTESRVTSSGQRCALLLSKAGIPITFFADCELPSALHSVDVVFFGSYIVDSKTVLCTSGTNALLEQARLRNIPAYLFTPSWSFDTAEELIKSIHSSNVPNTIWSSPPRGVSVIAPQYNIVSGAFISAIISDIGIFPFLLFKDEILKTNEIK